MGQIQTLDELLGMLLRRRLAIAAVAALGTVLALLYALSRPAIYEAAAVIEVESPTVGTEAQPAGTASAQRIQSIQHRLTTRENLLAAIERHGLYAGLPLTDDEKVNALRQSLRFQSVAAAAPVAYGSPPAVSAVIIFAQADTGPRAARVANDFAQAMLDAGVETQSGRARQTLAFFADEERRVAAELAALEAQVADYKSAEGDALPSLRDLRREEILGIETELRSLEARNAALTAERQAIETTTRTLRETERRQLETLAGELAGIAAQRAALLSDRDRLVAAMARMLEVERALAGYERQLDQLRIQFDQVTARRADAERAAKLEEGQQAERLSLLERAVTPEYPITGGRKRLVLAGAVASLLAGVVAAFLLDHLRPVLRTSTQLERQLGLRPVVAIPEIAHLRGSRRAPAPVRRVQTAAQSAVGVVADRLSALPRQTVALGGLALVVALVAAVA